jgi:hypothetical protein
MASEPPSSAAAVDVQARQLPLGGAHHHENFPIFTTIGKCRLRVAAILPSLSLILSIKFIAISTYWIFAGKDAWGG